MDFLKEINPAADLVSRDNFSTVSNSEMAEIYSPCQQFLLFSRSLSILLSCFSFSFYILSLFFLIFLRELLFYFLYVKVYIGMYETWTGVRARLRRWEWWTTTCWYGICLGESNLSWNSRFTANPDIWHLRISEIHGIIGVVQALHERNFSPTLLISLPRRFSVAEW